MRLIDYFDRGADLYPDRRLPARRDAGWTYTDVRATTHRVANGLLAAGLGRGTRLRSTVPTMRRPMPACWASCAPGMIWAPVNARNAIEENLYILDNTDVEFLFYHSSFAATLPRIREACPKIRDLRLPRCAVVRRMALASEGRGARPARRSRCRGDPGQLRRHHRPAQGRADHQPQHRDHELDLLGDCMPIERAAGPSHGGADDSRGGRLLLSAAALRRHQHLHGHRRSGRHPGRHREAPGDARLHAADARSTCCWPIPTSASTTTAR